MNFALHPRLKADCHCVGDLPLCRVLMMNDERFPWVILVPRRSGVREIHELERDDRQQLLEESCQLGRWLLQVFSGDKLNVAALGNVVPQLHIHHVVRDRQDACWPAPVWGCGEVKPLSSSELERRLELLRAFVNRIPGGRLFAGQATG